MTDNDTQELIARLYQHNKDYGEGRSQDFFRVCHDCRLAAYALETAGAEIERLKAENERIRQCSVSMEVYKLMCEERDAAVKCINDVWTYLELGSAKFIARTIREWRGKEAHDETE